mmetsp:Transcript_30955/g.61018  ORF Transcript_30955/g.61018 Transcript_30955/m.61018 type:complete len:89 (-) Transcript_30955:878-1144(-)
MKPMQNCMHLLECVAGCFPSYEPLYLSFYSSNPLFLFPCCHSFIDFQAEHSLSIDPHLQAVPVTSGGSERIARFIPICRLSTATAVSA